MLNPIQNPNQAGSQPSLAPADSVVAEEVSAVEALDFVVSWRLEKGGLWAQKSVEQMQPKMKIPV